LQHLQTEETRHLEGEEEALEEGRHLDKLLGQIPPVEAADEVMILLEEDEEDLMMELEHLQEVEGQVQCDQQ